jgi:hypothetical protein
MPSSCLRVSSIATTPEIEIITEYRPISYAPKNRAMTNELKRFKNPPKTEVPNSKSVWLLQRLAND